MKTISQFVFLLFSMMTFAQIEVIKQDILIKNDSIELPGTLSYTEQSKQLIIWIHGSGNVDRNGNQAGANVNANYIQQFREEINKEDIAFFSFDKRTANPKNIPYLKNIVFEDFISDVKEVTKFFKNKKQFDSITLVGHSQGSLIGMLSLEGVDKYISLAGPAAAIDKTIIKQISANSPIFTEIAKAHFKELKETGEIKEVNPMLVSIFAKQNQNFITSWMKYDPTQEIGKIKIPVLIINGDADLQVKVDDAKTLHESNKESKLVIVPQMNHVLKIVDNLGDNQASYFSSKFPISKKLISTIVEFVKH